MNIEKIKELKVGQEFKDKAALYRAIGVEPAKGKRNREYQDREIARSLEFEVVEKGKRKVRITKIHSDIKPKIDLRVNNKGGNNNVYSDYIDRLVVDMIITYGTVNATLNRIFVAGEEDYIPIFTQYYKDIKSSGYKSVAIRYDVHGFSLKQYLDVIGSMVNTMFKSSLNRLQKENILAWDKTYMMMTNSNIDPVIAEDYKYDNNCKTKIKKIEDDTLKKMGITRRELFLNNEHYDSFNELSLKSVVDYNEDIFAYWNVYKITLIEEDTERLKKLYPVNDFQEDIKELSRVIIERSHMRLNNQVSEQINKNTGEVKKYNPFQTNKLSEFVSRIEKDIFVYASSHLTREDFNNLFDPMQSETVGEPPLTPITQKCYDVETQAYLPF